MRQTGVPGVKLPELHAALLAYLAEHRFPDRAPEPEALVQDTRLGWRPGDGPVQVRLSGAADDVRRLAEFLAGLPGISATPVEVRNRTSGIAQSYMTVILNGEGK
jgi:hypothetical protein